MQLRRRSWGHKDVKKKCLGLIKLWINAWDYNRVALSWFSPIFIFITLAFLWWYDFANAQGTWNASLPVSSHLPPAIKYMESKHMNYVKGRKTNKISSTGEKVTECRLNESTPSWTHVYKLQVGVQTTGFMAPLAAVFPARATVTSMLSIC